MDEDDAEKNAEMRSVFPARILPCFKYTHMNRMQRQVLPAAFTLKENLVVCAPTGTAFYECDRVHGC